MVLKILQNMLRRIPKKQTSIRKSTNTSIIRSDKTTAKTAKLNTELNKSQEERKAIRMQNLQQKRMQELNQKRTKIRMQKLKQRRTQQITQKRIQDKRKKQNKKNRLHKHKSRKAGPVLTRISTSKTRHSITTGTSP